MSLIDYAIIVLFICIISIFYINHKIKKKKMRYKDSMITNVIYPSREQK